ncbi:MAG: PP2C family protein-serine/threonine phosphatase [Verrucomicrobiota bacterium]
MLENLHLIAVVLIIALVLILLLMRRIFSPLAQMREELKNTQRQWEGVVNFLGVFSRSLSANKNPGDILQHVVHYACRIMRSESAAIYQLEEHESTGRPVLRPVAIHGPFPLLEEQDSGTSLPRKLPDRLDELRRHPFALGEGIIGEVAQSETSMIVKNSSQPAGRALPFRVNTCLATPIPVRDRTIGVLCVANRRFGGGPFDHTDQRVNKQLALQVGVGIDLLNIYDERGNQERLVQELEFGREIQHSLLPPPKPNWHEYALSAFSEPALEVAGDSYDIVEIDDDRLMIVVADATGKGVPACMLSAMARSFVRSLAEGFNGMEEFLVKLNRCIFQDTDTAHFLTMGVLVLDRQTQVCEYACAGHTPLLIRFSDGTRRCIAPDGPALGLLPNELGVEFDTLSFSFTPGTSVMMFSDGLNEALNPEGEEFGIERLEELWEQESSSPEEMKDRMVGAVRDFVDGRAQLDDRTLVIVSRTCEAEASAGG